MLKERERRTFGPGSISPDDRLYRISEEFPKTVEKACLEASEAAEPGADFKSPSWSSYRRPEVPLKGICTENLLNSRFRPSDAPCSRLIELWYIGYSIFLIFGTRSKLGSRGAVPKIKEIGEKRE